jgi:hypothetical protein
MLNEKHVAVLMELADRDDGNPNALRQGKYPERAALLREIAANIESQASGQRVVVDREILENIATSAETIIAKRDRVRTVYNNADYIARKVRGWLSHSSPEETR